MHKLTILSLAMVMAGCALGPDYKAQAPDLPEQWPTEATILEDATAGESAEEEWENWWTRFEDPTLTALVERALDDNLELQQQLQRIEQARAQLGLARAGSWPTLSAQADAAREQPSAAMTPAELGGGQEQERYAVSAVLSYELDLWGRVARQREAAGALLAQSRFGTEAVRLNLVADVVTTYFSLRAAEQQVAYTERTLESREKTLELEQIRYESGATDPLSVRQARASLESTRAQLPALRQQAQTTRTALAYLVGYSPKELLSELDFGDRQLSDIELPDSVPAVLPSELLRRRPDIRAAEAGLIAANAEVGVAMAERLPRLDLSGLIGSAAPSTDQLFDAPAETWNLAAGLAAPLFDAGRLRAGVDSAKAGRELAELEYQMAVTNAFRDTRDALTLYETSDARVTAVRRQTQAIAETLELAEIQYDAGSIGFYELLDAQRGLLQAELALADAVRERLAASANLFKAMGGGWNAES